MMRPMATAPMADSTEKRIAPLLSSMPSRRLTSQATFAKMNPQDGGHGEDPFTAQCKLFCQHISDQLEGNQRQNEERPLWGPHTTYTFRLGFSSLYRALVNVMMAHHCVAVLSPGSRHLAQCESLHVAAPPAHCDSGRAPDSPAATPQTRDRLAVMDQRRMAPQVSRAVPQPLQPVVPALLPRPASRRSQWLRWRRRAIVRRASCAPQWLWSSWSWEKPSRSELPQQ